jgi:hypothetical protein
MKRRRFGYWCSSRLERGGIESRSEKVEEDTTTKKNKTIYHTGIRMQSTIESHSATFAKIRDVIEGALHNSQLCIT